MPPMQRRLFVVALMLMLAMQRGQGAAAVLLVGAATVSITPDKPVALSGQMRTRISTGVASPVTATVLVLQSRDGDRVLGTTTFVSCDLVTIPDEALVALRARVAEEISGFPVERIVVNATHTHTAPVMIEGYEDNGLDALFVWDADGRLLATAIDAPCPAQEVEGGGQVDADFWHPVRESLRADHGPGLHVLAWIGAAGDKSPHLLFRKEAEERMRRLRGLSRLEEIARRIVAGWKEALAGAEQDLSGDP